MNKELLISLLENTPIVAAIKNADGLARCLGSDAQVVFILYGTVVTIHEIVAQVKQSGKAAIVHIDLIDGLSSRETAVDFIAAQTEADGIITTKSSLSKHAKSLGLVTIQRFFLLDSIALVNIQKQLAQDTTDLIEILPGVMPKIIRRVSAITSSPIIAGGLISDKDDVMNALSAGAIAVSSTNPDVWFM